MGSETEVLLVLANKKGLHARAAAKFVKVVAQFNARVMVAKIAGAGGGSAQEASGGSILGLMMLGAECGAKLRLRLSGAQAAEVGTELRKLVENRFGEE
ncbi:MAG: HPr family phosphocarrier protein [Candidatus Sungbacteria bacterium]|uniref:HPr family phosphocarrier protein n=1 Tax=Candidatus Sungiibacteriota bacterium TaxID=2750080 RepID=A0A932VPT5_9BACT|nr:HPr family phosphocarrier protein [Candidatus Sungbacteria bacterium]